MSILTTTLWLAIALYLAKKVEPIIDRVIGLAWRKFVEVLTPKPTSRIRLFLEWAWYEVTRTR